MYAGGAGYHLYERNLTGWADISDQKLINDKENYDIFYIDLIGSDDENIYAAGLARTAQGIISFYDGSDWRILNGNFPTYLHSVLPSERGGVYICGSDGTLLYGDYKEGFQQAAIFNKSTDFSRMAEYDGVLYISSADGLFSLNGPGRAITPVTTNLKPPLRDVMIDVRDAMLEILDKETLAELAARQGRASIDPRGRHADALAGRRP